MTGRDRTPTGARASSTGRPAARRVTPRLHWVAMAAVLIGSILVLLVAGVIRAEFGADHRVAPPTDSVTVPDAVQAGGPIIDARGDVAQSYDIPDRTVVLTFDDGPDPTWTPQVLEVLRRHDVPATFFVLGSRAAEHPDLVKEIKESGSELGVHTFTHPDLAYMPEWRRQLELSATELALAGSAEVTSALVRPPYSSSTDALDDNSWPAVRDAGERGYLTVLTTHDGKDWARPGVDGIVANATTRNGEGAVVLLHDSGGDRSQTVAALDRLIPELQQQGYEFSTVADVLDQPTLNPEAGTADRLRGDLAVAAVNIATAAVSVLVVLVSVAGALVLTRLGVLLVLARRHARRHDDPRSEHARADLPAVTEPVSIIVPAFNERECIADTVRSLVGSDHEVEVIVVDDGSTDGTGDVVEALRLPSVTLLRQPNSGKPAALNAGIARARNELIVLVDGDTVFEPSTVPQLLQAFGDPGVGAVAGNTKVANRTGLLGWWQHIEYVMGFNVDRRAYDELQCMPTVPGAVGAFRRTALLDVGGVSDDTLAEDTDLTMAISRAGWRIVYQPDAIAWTEVPATLGQLWRQRYRWSYGTIQSMWKHRKAVTDHGRSGHYGRVGLLQLGMFQVLLPLLAPLMDVFLIYGLIFLDPVRTLLFWSTMMFAQLATGLFAFRVDREPMRALWLLPAQQIVYRQLMYAVVIQSLATAFAGLRLPWQKVSRATRSPELTRQSSQIAAVDR